MTNSIELNLARIEQLLSNSHGIRIPADLIRKHRLEPGMVLEDRGNELVLRPKGGSHKLSWEETAREMASAIEDWSDWDTASADGLDAIPWDHPAPDAATKRTVKPPKQSRSSRK